MRRVIPAALAVLAATVALIFWTGLDDHFARAAIGWQRDYQNALARALRALRGGEPGAVTAFLGICFAYGFLHALGPGHGKALIGAYGMASDVPLRRMAGMAAVASLAQATVAVLLVYAGVAVFGGARRQVEDLSAGLEPFSAAAIACLGVFLCWRGFRRLTRRAAAHDGHDGHAHSAGCGCGHAHAPDPGQVRAAATLREAAALIAGVALRPCTGALFLLILTWRLDLGGIGIAGAYVMGFGTMLVTVLAAVLAVALRRGVRVSLPAFGHAATVAGLIELGFGALVASLALSAMFRLI